MSLRAAVGVVWMLTLISSCASAPHDVVIWKVGSPHLRSIVPSKDIPPSLRNIAAGRDAELTIDVFPAAGFQATFRDSQARGSLPDLLVIDNMGILTGIPAQYGGYEGIAGEPTARTDFIRATGTFDSLLDRQGGWTYLHKHSPHHTRAKRVALTRPTCPDWTHWSDEHAEVIPIVKDIANAYLRGDHDRLRVIADIERLETTPAKSWQRARVDHVQPCGFVALDRLAFAWVQVVYESPSALGHKPLLVALRKTDPQSPWRVLLVSQDPLSTSGAFLQELQLMSRRIQVTTVPQAAVLLDPPPGVYPLPPQGQRFGSFTWRPSSSNARAMEIVEFAYNDDARLFVRQRPTEPEVSTGQLWTTRSTWQWRVWTVNRAGDISFSERRLFPN
jgi:hypothetical protein